MNFDIEGAIAGLLASFPPQSYHLPEEIMQRSDWERSLLAAYYRVREALRRDHGKKFSFLLCPLHDSVGPTIVLVPRLKMAAAYGGLEPPSIYIGERLSLYSSAKAEFRSDDSINEGSFHLSFRSWLPSESVEETYLNALFVE